VLHEGKEGKCPAPVGDLGPEDRPSRQKGPVEHHRDERDDAQARQQKGEVSGQRRVEGSRAEGGIAEETTEPFIGGTVVLGRPGDRTSEAS
jgi:ribosome assembly protein YihI (activator of Der GTPase)